MPAVKAQKVPTPLFGSERPRLAPPVPARSLVADLEASAKEIGLTLIPWQRYCGRYMYAIGADDNWLYQEIAVIVSRQQGKTTLLKPHIVRRLEMGRQILHVGQLRALPQKMFEGLIPIVEAKWPKARIRRAQGQESIEVPGGGLYVIGAAKHGAPRGLTIDDLLLDETRELKQEFVSAAIPTTTARPNPQILYLSNAGHETTVALNAVRSRADEDPSLAWLEWSAPPDLAADDVSGWLQANPAIGHFPGAMASLERLYRSAKLAGTMPDFETEHLCRWVVSLRERLVDEQDWMACRGPLGKPQRPAMGVALDPEGSRASVVIAWRVGDVIALTMVLDRKGDVNVDEIREEVVNLSRKHGAEVGYDPLTEPDLVRGLVKGKAKPVNGAKFAAASANFARRVAETSLRWADADPVSDDLTWTARKPDGEQGSFHAIRATEDRPITAALAAIRAVSLVSVEPPSPPRIR